VINKLIPEPVLKEGLTDKLVKKLHIRDTGVKVRGVNDILIRMSKCCNPCPATRSSASSRAGEDCRSHSVDCPNIDELDYDRDRMVEVAWDKKDERVHSVAIRVLTMDRPGMLASVSSAISSASANISHAEIITTEEKKAVLNFVVDVNDTGHLEKVLKNIRQVDGVLQAKRVRKG
jgi:GTP pyrophosphokinase